MLRVVATPIGNLGDITYRAVKVLMEADLILAEDTRTSQRLMSEYDINTPLKSYHQFNEKKREEEILSRLKGGEALALISDAGTPGVCDPGAQLIRKCREEGISVEVVPGPCAAIAALSLYGSEKPFQFIGFFPKKEGELKEALIDALTYSGITIGYETPHHLLKTLESIKQCAPGASLFVARELTKMHEETLEGSPEELLETFRKRKILGEYVLIIPGKPERFLGEPKALMEELQTSFGITQKEAMVIAAKLLKRRKKDLYDTLHRNSS